MIEKIVLVALVLTAAMCVGCVDTPVEMVVPTPVPTPTPMSAQIPTSTPEIEPVVRTVDITVDYTVKKLGITLYKDSYTYKLENTTMSDSEIRSMVQEKINEIAADYNINPDCVAYECSIVEVEL